MRARRPNSMKALLDVILSVLGMVLLLINDPESAGLVHRADYTLEVSWPDGLAVDLDTYILRPDDVVTYFGRKDTGYVSIDRDDLGTRNDPAPANIELTSFRAPLEGLYYISIHTYRVYGGAPDSGALAHVTLRDKRGRTVWHSAVPMPASRQETPVLAFIIKDGMVTAPRESSRYIVEMRNQS